MAITAVDLHWVGTAARREMNGPQTLRMRYKVQLDQFEADQQLKILDDARIPAQGDQIALRGVTYYVSSVEVEPPDDSNRILWFVTTELTDTPNSGGGDLDQPPGNNNPNPADDTPYWDFDSGDGVKYVRTDVDGNLIVLSNKRPPDPVQIFEPRPVVTFHRNELSFTYATQRQYMGKVNSSAWNGAPAKSVLCRKIRAVQRWRNGVPFYQVSYQFEFRDEPQGWQFRLVSMDIYELITTVAEDGTRTEELKPIYTDNGEPIQEPQLLDSGGETCPPGYEDETDWKVYKEVDFGPLNITLPS